MCVGELEGEVPSLSRIGSGAWRSLMRLDRAGLDVMTNENKRSEQEYFYFSRCFCIYSVMQRAYDIEKQPLITHGAKRHGQSGVCRNKQTMQPEENCAGCKLQVSSQGKNTTRTLIFLRKAV